MTNWESGLETYWPVGIGGGGIGAREKVKDPDKHLKMDAWMDRIIRKNTRSNIKYSISSKSNVRQAPMCMY